jgi:hypothetical protein
LYFSCDFSFYRPLASPIARTIGEQHPNAKLLVGECMAWLINIVFYLFVEWPKGINVDFSLKLLHWEIVDYRLQTYGYFVSVRHLHGIGM